MSVPARALLQSVARVALLARRGPIADQLALVAASPASARIPHRHPAAALPEHVKPPQDLEFFNGLGGFDEDGREYVTVLEQGATTPAPWINVIANPAFGFQVSAEGSGYTWAENSRENQLTPWSNDPVCDPAGEALYVRDEDTGDLWTATAQPIRDQRQLHRAPRPRLQPLRAPGPRHRPRTAAVRAAGRPGEDLAPDAAQPLRPAAPPVGHRLCGVGARHLARRLRPVHRHRDRRGHRRDAGAQSTGASHFPGASPLPTWAAGRPPSPPTAPSSSAAAASSRRRRRWQATRPLSGATGAGLDPCAALQRVVELERGRKRRSRFLPGPVQVRGPGPRAGHPLPRCRSRRRAVAGDRATGRRCSAPCRSRRPTAPWTSCSMAGCCTRRWPAASGRARPSTRPAAPTAFATSCRTAWRCPSPCRSETRAHLLRAAGRQFVEGDVQHWWLPHSGQGVRTRISDDRVWLAYAAATYVASSGDAAVLDEMVPFLDGPPLAPGRTRCLLPADGRRRAGQPVRALRARAGPVPRAHRARSGCR